MCSKIVTNVSLWCRIFYIEEAVCIMDSEGIQDLLIPSIQFCSKSKTAVKKTKTIPFLKIRIEMFISVSMS